LDAFLHRDWERGMRRDDLPWMRFALFTLGERGRIFAWTYHHLLLDGWSQGRVVDELFGCYREIAAGREPALPAPVPFREYIAWLETRSLPAEPFWRHYLAGF